MDAEKQLCNVIVNLQRQLNEALVTIADLVSQSCGDSNGVISTHAISAYADAVDLLDRYGLVEHIGAAVGRVRRARIKQSALLRLLDNAESTAIERNGAEK